MVSLDIGQYTLNMYVWVILIKSDVQRMCMSSGRGVYQETENLLTFVVVDIQVVRSREDGDEGGKTCSLTLPIHAVAVKEKQTNRLRYRYSNETPHCR